MAANYGQISSTDSCQSDQRATRARSGGGSRRSAARQESEADEDGSGWSSSRKLAEPIQRVTAQQPELQSRQAFVGKPIFASDVVGVLESLPLLQCSVDFSKPDGLRTRPLLVENKKIYVCEYYVSIWSPVFRAAFFPGDGQDFERRDEKQTLAIPNTKYGNVLDLLECMYPQERPITDQNIHRILPLAYEYQCDEILRRCTDYLKQAPLRAMDKIVLADRFYLDALLNFCLKQIRIGGGQLDFYSNQYERLSDRTKVQILEKLHHIKSSEVARRVEARPIVEELDLEEIESPNVLTARLSRFNQKSQLFFSVLRTKSGRHYYCNPYYVAAWSRLLAEEVLSYNRLEFDCSTLTDEETAHFLLAVHPPISKLTDSNVHHVLRAACKLESPGVIRRCIMFLLSSRSELEVIEKLVLLDKCFLHELLDACLRCGVWDLNDGLRLSVSPLYDCLSSRAKAAILDRIANLLQTTTATTDYLVEGGRTTGISGHFCYKCRKRSACHNIVWLCANCNSYCPELAKVT